MGSTAQATTAEKYKDFVTKAWKLFENCKKMLRKLYDLADTVPVHVEPEQVWIEFHETAGRVDLRLLSPVGRANQPAKIQE
jgi:hypothetical protein